MMYGPRSYLFSRPAPKSSDSSPSKSNRNEPAITSAPRTAIPTPSDHTMSPRTAANSPSMTSQPVVIPSRAGRDSKSTREKHRQSERRPSPYNGSRSRDSSERRRASDLHSPDAIPPSVAALLAMTSIPPQKRNASTRRSSKSRQQKLTVEAVFQHTASEKFDTFSEPKSPMDLLLSPPEDLFDDDALGSENGLESVLSNRTRSSESVPSLDGVSIGDSPTLSPLSTPQSRGRKSLPTRRVEPISFDLELSNPEHPLAVQDIEVEELDFRVFEKTTSVEEVTSPAKRSTRSTKSMFKSNLTASLRALKNAARTISSLKPPVVAPDDFLTRSIISIDPQIPFTDERMPPILDDAPTPALRRYLNPTHLENIAPSLAQTAQPIKCSASIQMQTYKPRSKSNSPSTSRRTSVASAEDAFLDVAAGPVGRQREVRENSDFIRVAVMEMAMRRNGKLDDKVPGRARWCLPPRKITTKPYEITKSGVPRRWIAITQ